MPNYRVTVYRTDIYEIDVDAEDKFGARAAALDVVEADEEYVQPLDTDYDYEIEELS